MYVYELYYFVVYLALNFNDCNHIVPSYFCSKLRVALNLIIDNGVYIYILSNKNTIFQQHDLNLNKLFILKAIISTKNDDV